MGKTLPKTLCVSASFAQRHTMGPNSGYHSGNSAFILIRKFSPPHRTAFVSFILFYAHQLCNDMLYSPVDFPIWISRGVTGVVIHHPFLISFPAAC